MDIQTLTQADKAFFTTLGPFFVSAEVRQATGSAMTSESDYRWTVVKQARKVVAFAGLQPRKNGNADFVAIYSTAGDEAKKAAIQGALDDAKALGLKEVRVLAKIENSDFYRELGFEAGVMRGGFRQFAKGLQ